MLKQGVKHLLKQWGYTVYPTKKLPFGCDSKEDISRISPDLKISVIFDVGANKGQTALEYRQIFPDATIFSFEPVNETFTVLKTTTESNANIFSYNLALGDSNGQEQILVEGTSGSNSILNATRLSPKSDQSLETINLMTLDHFLENCDHPIDHIDLLKIDTEGYEVQVLKGAKSALSAGKILYIFTEVTFRDNDTQHTHFLTLQEILKEYNFNFVGLYDVYPYWGGGNSLDYCNALFKRWEKGKQLKMWE